MQLFMWLPVPQRLQHRFLGTEAAQTDLRQEILQNSTSQRAGLQRAFSHLTLTYIDWWSARNAQHSHLQLLSNDFFVSR
jgi:hypothetical protein